MKERGASGSIYIEEAIDSVTTASDAEGADAEAAAATETAANSSTDKSKTCAKAEVHSGHRKRLRQSFLKSGDLNGLHEHQMLELLLFYAIPRRDVNPIAHELIDRFGSLRGVLNADVSELINSKLSENAAVLIKLAGIISTYSEQAILQNIIFPSIDSIIDFSYGLLRHSSDERVCIICLNKAQKLLHVDTIRLGNSKRISFPKRIIVESALRNCASSIVIAHNHPSGQCRPSGDDLNSTDELHSLLDELGITLAEHIIVGYPFCYAILKDYTKDISGLL